MFILNLFYSFEIKLRINRIYFQDVKDKKIVDFKVQIYQVSCNEFYFFICIFYDEFIKKITQNKLIKLKIYNIKFNLIYR